MDHEPASVVSRTGLISLLVLHAVAIGLVFLMVSTIGNAFVDHYKVIGFASTPRFEVIRQLADFVSRYAIVFVAVVGVDVLIARWIAKHRARWLSAYSHACLAAIALTMFIAVTWMINPIVAHARNAGGGAAQGDPAVASAR